LTLINAVQRLNYSRKKLLKKISGTTKIKPKKYLKE